MRNRMYGGVRGRKTKVGEKLLRFPPTRLNIFFSIGENSLNSVYSLELIVYRAILLYGEAAVNYKL